MQRSCLPGEQRAVILTARSKGCSFAKCRVSTVCAAVPWLLVSPCGNQVWGPVQENADAMAVAIAASTMVICH